MRKTRKAGGEKETKMDGRGEELDWAGREDGDGQRFEVGKKTPVI